MDKKEALKKIAEKLLNFNKRQIEGKTLDKLIYETCNKLDKNLKYEFRNFLLALELINYTKDPQYRHDQLFIIEKKTIRKYLGVIKNGNY